MFAPNHKLRRAVTALAKRQRWQATRGRTRADPEDPHTPRKTTRAASRLSRPGPTDRLGRAHAGPSRPRRLSTLARRAALDRHPQPLTGVGHEASKPRERQTGTRSAPTREKRHRRVMRGVLANRIRTAETTDRAAHESSVSRKTVAEVPLAGLSFPVKDTQVENLCYERLRRPARAS